MLTKTKFNKFKHSKVQQRGIMEQLLILGGTLAIPAVTASIMFINARYRISNPDEYLVKTGMLIKDMKISKQSLQLPFQTYRYIKMQPINYSFDLNSMSQEKLEFVLPCVFTIGPKDDIESIEKYARLLPTNKNDEITHIYSIIQGIIEGETRALSASMTIEQIFSDRKTYKELLLKEIQDELDVFGLKIYNVNIKELQDTPGSEYFERVRQKKRSEAENNAKINIAEAKKVGDIGQKQREAETRQQLAMLEAETMLKENERKQEIEKSNAELNVIKNQAFQKSEISKIEAQNAAKIKEAELLREVEQKRIAMETEKLRATELSRAQVKAETNVKDAEGIATSLKLKADAELYSEQKKAEATLYSEQKRADGILSVYEAQSSGVEKLIVVFGNDKNALYQYMMIDKDVYEKLAHANAIAIKDLKPKIVQWNTTSSDKNVNAIADVFKMMPVVIDTINDQTGIKPPNWMVNMDNVNKE